VLESALGLNSIDFGMLYYTKYIHKIEIFTDKLNIRKIVGIADNSESRDTNLI
jgi:hypothetical protein